MADQIFRSYVSILTTYDHPSGESRPLVSPPSLDPDRERAGTVTHPGFGPVLEFPPFRKGCGEEPFRTGCGVRGAGSGREAPRVRRPFPSTIPAVVQILYPTPTLDVQNVRAVSHRGRFMWGRRVRPDGTNPGSRLGRCKRGFTYPPLVGGSSGRARLEPVNLYKPLLPVLNPTTLPFLQDRSHESTVGSNGTDFRH